MAGWLLRHKLNDPAGAETHLRWYREIRSRKRAAAHPQLPESPVQRQEKEAGPEGDGTLLPPLGNDVVVVCGLPRSGTSMIMQMLAAGGLPVLTDGKREADEDNPLGYLEFDPVKQPRGYADWIAQAAGKAVKVVAPLANLLPEGPAYRVIFIERDLDEVLRSQARMIERRGEQVEDTPERREHLRGEYARMTERVKALFAARTDAQLLVLAHADAMRNPESAARRLNLFCGGELRVPEMTACVRPELHRQQNPSRA
ncbi:MAG TPA: hypothetical protein VHW09_06555 [Bryobacteraceae bacterium]|jgi:hypothetical protein|nr:hypothetical protein [Bryobacteraceae bacterium]